MTEDEAALRRNYPACFNSAMMPLKIDIHLDLQLTYPNETLAAWTSSPVYLRNFLRPNARRIDLKGNSGAVITHQQKLYAWERLMWLRHDLTGLTWRPLTADERRELKLRLPRKPKEEIES
jgi:sRNA-binding protein